MVWTLNFKACTQYSPPPWFLDCMDVNWTCLHVTPSHIPWPSVWARLYLALLQYDIHPQLRVTHRLNDMSYNRKFLQISWFCGYYVKVFSAKFWAWHPLARQKRAICESFLQKSYFSKSFLPQKFSTVRYMDVSHNSMWLATRRWSTCTSSDVVGFCHWPSYAV